MKSIFLPALNQWVIIALPLHAGGTGIWDEVLAIIGTIAFIIILIHLFFFEGRQDEQSQTKDESTHHVNQKH